MPAWDELAPEDRVVAARFMECFAGFLSYTDAHIARVFEFLARTGDLDRTLVIAISDNGASAEGGARGSINDARLWNGAAAGRKELRARIDELGTPSAHNNYPWGWTMAGNTPFKRWKREVHEGGIADPCIVSWAARLASDGSVRRQFAHAIDVMPTVLELAGIEAPAELDGVAQSPIDGTSFAYLLRDGGRDEVGRHETQYFEMLGSRGIYDCGWKAVAFHPIGGMYDDGLDPDAPFSEDAWELYHVAEDLSETHDLAEAEPARLRAMIDLWWEHARRNDVLPLDNRPLAAIMNPRPSSRTGRDTYVYYPGGSLVPEAVAVNVRNRSHVITADLDVPAGVVANGMLLAFGSALGGFALYLRDGRLRYVHNLYGTQRTVIGSEAHLTPGRHAGAFAFTKTADFTGRGELLLDGKVVGRADIPHFTPVRFSITGAGLTCGYEYGPPIGDDYDTPFTVNVGIARVVVDVSGAPYRDPEGEFDAIMSEQ